MSYLKKEFKMLLRTPAFLMNCVLINFLWPALMYAVYMLWGSSDSFEILLNDYRNGNEKMLVYVPVLVIIISIIVTAANSIASSSVTREGTGYIFMKYIPMTIREQISVKALVSIIISYGCLALYIVVGCVVIDIKASTTIYYLVLSFMGVVFVTYMGVLLDTVNPKLLWDDEINALRGNSTIFFGMAYAMILGVILLGLAYVLLEFTSLEITIINLIIVVFMIIMDIFTYVNCMNTCQDNMEE